METTLLDRALLGGDELEAPRELEDGLGSPHEGRVHHAAVHRERAHAFFGCHARGFDDLERVCYLVVGRPEDLVGDRDLGGMAHAPS